MHQQQKKARRAKAYHMKRRFHKLQKVENEMTIVLTVQISARFMPYRSAARSITDWIQQIWIKVNRIHLLRWIDPIWIGSNWIKFGHKVSRLVIGSSAQCGHSCRSEQNKDCLNIHVLL